ncbi:hypothetical protein [Helicobacter sp. 23-1045]
MQNLHCVPSLRDSALAKSWQSMLDTAIFVRFCAILHARFCEIWIRFCDFAIFLLSQKFWIATKILADFLTMTNYV